ncbi:protein HGH1 homolog [Saccoglossus kowalevskii]|uniref:Protein HGH1 homolog n=1 Tax=Saccoglossus kowalevskii TaxID=10224 RepID=A0ABM0GY22_SACKO|nr:PREDICTED: protein FAM203A-like [Saccoglossus kowalevskii]
MAGKKELEELIPFLTLNERIDVLSVALHHIVGLTGTVDGILLMASDKRYIEALFPLTRHPQDAIATDSYLTLVNLSSNKTVASSIVADYDIVPHFLEYVTKSDSLHADYVCMILSNLSRNNECCVKVTQYLQKIDGGFNQIVEAFCKEKFNPKNNLHYLGPFLSNLTQLHEGRKAVLDKDRCIIQRLIPFTQYEASDIRRGGIVATLKNACFESDYHSWLLSDSVDILPRLLLPLAGPEELTEDEMDGMPFDLQYLEEDKKREPDPDIRQMLIEAVFQLCTTKEGRDIVKAKKTYIILRELDRWEKDPKVKSTCQKLISLLIGDDPPDDLSDLKKVKIPEDVQKQLDEADKQEEEEFANAEI